MSFIIQKLLAPVLSNMWEPIYLKMLPLQRTLLQGLNYNCRVHLYMDLLPHQLPLQITLYTGFLPRPSTPLYWPHTTAKYPFICASYHFQVPLYTGLLKLQNTPLYGPLTTSISGWLSSSSMTYTRPLRAAMCSGVEPLLLVKFGEHPPSFSSTEITSRWPYLWHTDLSTAIDVFLRD